MRQRLRRLIDILDGKPRGGKGQSLVEMTLTTPILILMVLSLTEIGFLANYYLTMMDLVREAGRRGSNLNPVIWEDGDSRNYERLDCDTAEGSFNLRQNDSYDRPSPRGPQASRYGYQDGKEGQPGFFDGVVCQIVTTMAPMRIELTEPPTNPDEPTLYKKNEIVVSAVAFVTMNYSNSYLGNLKPPGGARGTGWSTLGYPLQGPDYRWVTVTGRYPRANRMCFKADTGAPGGQAGDIRDPFDFKRPEFYSFWNSGSGIVDEGEDSTIRSVADANSQLVRGFIFTGYYEMPNQDCLGSDFTVQEIERRLNQNYSNKELTVYTRNGGLVLVEMHWQYHPIFFGPLFQSFSGNPANDPVLYVYGFFPVVAAEPTSTPDN